jgi:hypothetical protein
VFETEEEFKDSAFSGAVGADDAHPLTSIYLEGTIYKDILFGEGFAYIIERNHFLAISRQLSAISLSLCAWRIAHSEKKEKSWKLLKILFNKP